MKRSKIPIESFGPELMAALLAGSLREVRFPLPYRFAVQFRRRIHQLRARMREERHEKSKQVERAQVSVLWGKEAGLTEPLLRRTVSGNKVPEDLNCPAVVRIKPYDSEFAKALEAAGVSIPTDGGTDLQLPEALQSDDPLAAFDPTRNE